MSNLKKDFGNKLRSVRLEKGITQEQLAAEVGITVESISNLERGLYGPKFENLEKIAESLNIPVKELFDFKKS
jgi:transcriptional regulator with XRE-family HTH domain